MKIGISLIVLTYGIDRICKWLVVDVLNISDQSITIFPFLNMVFVRNTGISFGMLQNENALSQWFLAIFAFLVIIFLLAWLFRSNSKILSAGLGMVIGGAAGNATDRVIWGHVVDFINFHIGNWHYPVFNIADIAIVCGFGLILLDGLFVRRHKGITG